MTIAFDLIVVNCANTKWQDFKVEDQIYVIGERQKTVPIPNIVNDDPSQVCFKFFASNNPSTNAI